MAIPGDMMDKALNGMEALYRRGIRYPISYAGAESDISGEFPQAYQSQEMINVMRGGSNRLLLGVTGSIGTGKSTVAKMFEELGSPIIDFDVLARVVVEPDQPAYQDIVNYFGEQVLSEDKTLDREKLREIVFSDMEKGVQPADATYKHLIIPKLWKGFWSHFDWHKASEAGMKEAGLKYSGKIKFVKTDMYWRLNHEVVPKEKALTCTDCHKKDGAIDFKALDYKGDPAAVGGRKKLHVPHD